MLNFVVRAALLSSAFAPIMLIWAMVSLITHKCLEIKTITLFVLFLLFLFLPFIIFFICKNNFSGHSIQCTSLSLLNKGGEGFIGTYLLPFLSYAITDSWYLLMVIILLALTLIMWINNSYYYNPLLPIFGYRFYEITNSSDVKYIVLSNRKVLDIKDITNVYDITDYLKLDMSR